MKKRTLFFILLMLTIMLPSCKHIFNHAERPPHWFDYYTEFHQKEYIQQFNTFINSLPEGDTSPHLAQIKQFYIENNYEPYWTYRGFQEGRIDSLLHYLSTSYEHGIPDTFFLYPAISHSIELLKNHHLPNNRFLYDTLANLEIKLTSAFLKYVESLTFGATDPRTANGGKWLIPYLKSDSAFISSTLKQIHHYKSVLSDCQPKNPEYQILQQELRRLHALADKPRATIPENVVFKGQQSTILPNVCKRLQLTGELSKNYQNRTTLTDSLLYSINLFRKNNGIPESDSLDIETIRKLNLPISYFIEKISCNLERLRWHSIPEKGDSYIAVNIPDYTLQTFVHDSLAFKTRICCGKTQNPNSDPLRIKNKIIKAFKAETPLLHSQISRVVLNPEWSIPYDIIKDEYYYKLCQSNTAVINRERLFVKDARTGRQINPQDIDWNEVNPKNIPYRLYQSSGKYNALGQIKFDFANTESVYLHDTNNKGAFKRRKRALSHGCVRVENPFTLAQILYEFNGFDTTKIEQLGILVGNEPTSEEGEKYLENILRKDSIREAHLTDAERLFYRKLKPTSVSFKNKMDLFIEYRTCFADEKGQVQYRDDVYYKDSNILELLRR